MLALSGETVHHTSANEGWCKCDAVNMAAFVVSLDFPVDCPLPIQSHDFVSTYNPCSKTKGPSRGSLTRALKDFMALIMVKLGRPRTSPPSISSSPLPTRQGDRSCFCQPYTRQWWSHYNLCPKIGGIAGYIFARNHCKQHQRSLGYWLGH